jgi:hypothetical protein
MSFWNRINFSLFLLLASGVSHAATTIGAPSSGIFAKPGTLLQDAVDFVEGPWALFASIASLGAALFVWALGARSEEGLGKLGKVFIAGILFLNIAGLITALQAY